MKQVHCILRFAHCISKFVYK